MQYLGGKSRLAKKIVDVIKARAPETIGVLEPFMGGGAMTLELAKWRPVLAGDAFPGLVDFYRAVKAGLRSPWLGSVPEDVYDQAKKSAESGSRCPEIVLIGFALSRSGMWFGRRAAAKLFSKNQYGSYFNNWADKFCSEQNIYLTDTCDYSDFTRLIRPGLAVYCDPPYANTQGYETGNWDVSRFCETVRHWTRLGARVFVSEFEAPFREIARFERPISIGSANKPRRLCIDRLFEVEP